MVKIGRQGLRSDRRQEVWEHWKAGESISEISRVVASPPGRTFSILLPFGGIYQPPQRRRPGALTVVEREEISRGLAAGEPHRAIGRRLGRSASTITREMAKNQGPRRYRAVDADDRAWRRARRPKTCLLAQRPELRTLVAARLTLDLVAGGSFGVAGQATSDRFADAGVGVVHRHPWERWTGRSRLLGSTGRPSYWVDNTMWVRTGA